MRRLRRKLNYSNVVATLALFIALGGGAYAAIRLPSNSVGTKQIKNRAVTLKKISPSAQRVLRGRNGAKGTAGRNGTAVAFAHVLVDGTLDTANSHNVSAASRDAGFTGLTCITVTTPVKNATATLDQARGGARGGTNIILGSEDPLGVIAAQVGAHGCPGGTNVLLKTYDISGADHNFAFWVNLN